MMNEDKYYDRREKNITYLVNGMQVVLDACLEMEKKLANVQFFLGKLAFSFRWEVIRSLQTFKQHHSSKHKSLTFGATQCTTVVDQIEKSSEKEKAIKNQETFQIKVKKCSLTPLFYFHLTFLVVLKRQFGNQIGFLKAF